jgi:hypothetical protein
MPRDKWKTQNSRAEKYKLESEESRLLEKETLDYHKPRTPPDEFVDRRAVAELRRWVAILEGREGTDVPRSLIIGCIAAVDDFRLRHEMEQVLKSTSSLAREAAQASLRIMEQKALDHLLNDSND